MKHFENLYSLMYRTIEDFVAENYGENAENARYNLSKMAEAVTNAIPTKIAETDTPHIVIIRCHDAECQHPHWEKIPQIFPSLEAAKCAAEKAAEDVAESLNSGCTVKCRSFGCTHFEPDEQYCAGNMSQSYVTVNCYQMESEIDDTGETYPVEEYFII